MQPAIAYHDFAQPRSLIEERPARPPIIGKIRPGIKVLTAAAKGSQRAVELHDRMLATGESFESIGEAIARETGISHPLVPRNTGYFTCRRSDFSNPATADDILKRYGEDRGDGVKLWRFPIQFVFDDWLRNLPNQLAAWGHSGRRFFSEYGADGLRYCKTYAPAEVDQRAQRAKRLFGGRTTILRQDDDIPDGVCDPHQCPQYQSRQCNLSASFLFAVSEIKGLGLIELPTNSIYVLQKAYAAMQTVALARGGRLTGVQFWLSKQEVEITRIDESGQPVRQAQMLTMLDAEIDLGALLDGGDQMVPALEAASLAAAALQGPGTQTEHADDAATVIDVPADPFVPDDPEDLRSAIHDLTARLGLAHEGGKGALRIYAHVMFGKGWANRVTDLQRMVRAMQGGLADPATFREQVSATVREFVPAA